MIISLSVVGYFCEVPLPPGCKTQTGKRHAVLAQVAHVNKHFMYLQPCRHWGLVYFAEVLYLWCWIHNFCTLRPLANPLMPVAVVARLKV